MQAIPTVYKDIRFRSRLEAKWAAFFDLIGWEWDYEPTDLAGYIPDFVVQFREPMIVEVKPGQTIESLRESVPKIRASGWDKEALVVGDSPKTPRKYDHIGFVALGLLSERSDSYDEGVLMKCEQCDEFSIFHSVGHPRCRKNWCHEGSGEHIDAPGGWFEHWANACNVTQWRKS